MGIPVLTGSVFRLPAGILTDKLGGKPVFVALLFLCAVPMYLLATVESFFGFALCSFGFGLAGVSFAIGIAYSSVWYPRANQGTALGIFGAGNAGAAATTLFAPTLLKMLTADGTAIEGWRTLPKLYAAMLAATGLIMLVFANNKKPAAARKTLRGMLKPLRKVRVWRFGLYYFLVFGCFVAFSQWLVPYFVNVYQLSLVTAGILAALFSFPSGVIRAAGGWMSDRWGARQSDVLGPCHINRGVLRPCRSQDGNLFAGKRHHGQALRHSHCNQRTQYYYRRQALSADAKAQDLRTTRQRDPRTAHTRNVAGAGGPGGAKGHEEAAAGQRGHPGFSFKPTCGSLLWLVVLLGSIWGIGKAGVYKHIPDYFPRKRSGSLAAWSVCSVGSADFSVRSFLGTYSRLPDFGPVVGCSCCLLSAVCLRWMHLRRTKADGQGRASGGP